ncbi:SAM-dependent methyltransferase [Actinoplanes sp. NPDC049316]|uniref:SAM-dependent methyltransferase n=1 Tax=Actinoplanes sp. NPDC049316 TaxID=3154727 RepID=UPI003430887D
MTGEHHLPTGIDPNRPSAARIYDAFLGGNHNFAADRAVADRARELVPELPRIVQANRAFLSRAVRFAAARGIRQFLDLGAGIPANDNTHEVAREVQPDARVVYVDIDPTAVLHAREIIGADPRTVVVQGDLQRPETVLTDPDLRGLLDLGEPVCVLMIAVLHFAPDSAELTAALRHYREAVAAGSCLAISHATGTARAEEMERFVDLYNRTGTPLVPRDRERVEALLEGWDVVEPGVVHSTEWRPDPGGDLSGDPAATLTYVGVGTKP